MTAIDADLLEPVAQDAVYRFSKTWAFIWPDAEPPEHIERAVRALVAAGADSTTVCGALIIAAQKKHLPDDDVFTYACGIVRNQLAARDAISLLSEAAVPDALEETEPPRKRWWRRR